MIVQARGQGRQVLRIAQKDIDALAAPVPVAKHERGAAAKGPIGGGKWPSRLAMHAIALGQRTSHSAIKVPPSASGRGSRTGERMRRRLGRRPWPSRSRSHAPRGIGAPPPAGPQEKAIGDAGRHGVLVCRDQTSQAIAIDGLRQRRVDCRKDPGIPVGRMGFRRHSDQGEV